METARMTVPIGGGMGLAAEGSLSTMTNCAAVTSAVDAYATRVLKAKSPPEACIDESLGPYVTSLLRCSLAGNDDSDIINIPEFESLMELVQEHCSCDRETAQSALESIATAVRTGVVEERLPTSRTFSGIGGGSASGSPWCTSMGGDTNAIDSISLLGEVWKESEMTLNKAATQESSDSASSQEQTLNLGVQSGFAESNEPEVGDRGVVSPGTSDTPLKPDRLIPVDLMGVLDDPSTPKTEKGVIPEFSCESSAQKETVGQSKKTSKEEAEDLAAALFRPSRTRQGGNEGESMKSPKLKPMSVPYAGMQGMAPLEPEMAPYYGSQHDGAQQIQQQLDSAVEILLSMNADLGEEAACEAALVANTDVNVAQYIIDGALSARPVCRHVLSEGCYRSDCQFSHDVEGHTCHFWLRGRCGKGASCRFLHGFSEKLLEGINQEALQQQPRGSGEGAVNGGFSLDGTAVSSAVKSEPVPIKTTNLLQHNSSLSFSAPQHEANPFAFMSSSQEAFDSPAYTFPPQALSSTHNGAGWEHSTLESAMKPSTGEQSNSASGSGSSFSFANIASKGYNQASFTPAATTGGIGDALEASRSDEKLAPQKTTYVKIPQDLWNAHENRDSAVFQTSDPLERYREVSSSATRSDVIDLHFQSTRTFSVVLSTVLPEKLVDHEEVWVVTGSGHHVGTSTHQKGGGALEKAVLSWLLMEGYDFVKGRDRNGYGGAVLVKR